MKAVLRLMLLYFTGTPVLRGITTVGVIAMVLGWLGALYLPPLVAQHGLPSRFSLFQESLIGMAPIIGMIGLLFGGALMPTMTARFAAGHWLYVLPYGRPKVLVSALLTVLLLTVIGAATIALYYVQTPLPPETAFRRALAPLLLTYTLLYVVLWLIGRHRSPVGLLAGTLVIIATLTLPLRYIFFPVTPPRWPLAASGVLWAAFALYLLLAPRLRGLVAKGNALTRRPAWAEPNAYESGTEVDFLIGTARPWLFALGQAVPAALVTYFIDRPVVASVWLFYFAIMSAVAGTAASFAASRSRALWLRAHWTRSEIFTRVEKAFWRHHGYVLGTQFLLFVAAGSYLGLPTRMLAWGLPLLLLGTAASTYVGLITTRGLGWRDAALAVVTMALMLATAVYIFEYTFDIFEYTFDMDVPLATVAMLEVALAALALALRQLAKYRWARLDWMLCRPELGMRAAT